VPVHWQLVVDAGEPHDQARFWAGALGYLVEDNAALVERLRSAGAVGPQDVAEFDGRPAFRDLIAVRHPDDPVHPMTGSGQGRRILFQRVPEHKQVKNRLHLDLSVGPERRDAEVERLLALGARVLRRVADRGSEHVTMADPEGNEFDVQ
jgi:hypothetical protein